jgi:hypothetical protein
MTLTSLKRYRLKVFEDLSTAFLTMPWRRKNLLPRSPMFDHSREPRIEVIVEAKGSSEAPGTRGRRQACSAPTESRSFLDAQALCFNFNERAACREITDALRPFAFAISLMIARPRQSAFIGLRW